MASNNNSNPRQTGQIGNIIERWQHEFNAVDPRRLNADRGNEASQDIGAADTTDNADRESENWHEEDVQLAIAWMKPKTGSESRGLVAHYYNSEKQNILNFHQATPSAECPGLKVQPLDHQSKALGMIEFNKDGILLGDPPGLGKTLPAMLATVKAISDAQNFSIIITHASCVEQWAKEYEMSFESDAVKVLVLTDPDISCAELVEYDVVITTYDFIVDQCRKREIYLDQIKNQAELDRPSLSIVDDVLTTQSTKKFPYIVCDEINGFEMADTQAMKRLCWFMGYCVTPVLISGHPMENSWLGTFVFGRLLHSHHPAQQENIFRKGFGTFDDWGDIGPPRNSAFFRFMYYLNAFIIRRPQSTIQGMPPLISAEIIFQLSAEELANSDHHFREYMASVDQDDDVDGDWASMVLAGQHTMHPAMADLMLFKHVLGEKRSVSENDPRLDNLLEDTEFEKWNETLETLRSKGSWRSSRITAIIDQLNRCRDRQHDASILIFEESAHFLDILDIAFTQMDNPIQDCLRLDGRVSAHDRAQVLETFKAKSGFKVLLLSRATGGIGLSLPEANIVFLCSTWSNAAWEDRAIRRAWRYKQTKPVQVFRFVAQCDHDDYRQRMRDEDDAYNAMIEGVLTKPDGAPPLLVRRLTAHP